MPWSAFFAKMHEGYPSQAGNESAMSARSSKKQKTSGKASPDASAGLALDKEEQAILAQAHEQSPVNADKAKTLRKILNAQKKAGGEGASSFKRPAAAAAAVVVAICFFGQAEDGRAGDQGGAWHERFFCMIFP